MTTPMQVKILDSNRSVIQSIDGQYDNGVFIYKEGDHFGLGGVTKRISINYKQTYDEKQGLKVVKVALVIFDGKNYNQVDFEKNQQENEVDINDYINQDELADYKEESMMEKPFNLAELLPIIVLLGTGAIVIILYFMGGNIAKEMSISYTIVNNTANQCVVFGKIAINQTHQLMNIYNRTLAKC